MAIESKGEQFAQYAGGQLDATADRFADVLVNAGYASYKSTSGVAVCKLADCGDIREHPDGTICSSDTLFVHYNKSRAEGLKPVQAMASAFQTTVPPECPITGIIYKNLGRLEMIPPSSSSEFTLASLTPALLGGAQLLQREGSKDGQVLIYVAAAVGLYAFMCILCKGGWSNINRSRGNG